MVGTSHYIPDRRSVLPPRVFRAICLALFVKVSVQYGRLALTSRDMSMKGLGDHKWDLAAKKMGYRNLWVLSKQEMSQFLGMYVVEVMAACCKGWCCYPTFGKSIRPLLVHHIFSMLFLSSWLMQGYQMPAGEDSRYYTDIFCESMRNMNGMSYISGVECFGIVETLLPRKMTSIRFLARICTIGWVIPFAGFIGPLYSIRLTQLMRKEIKLAKDEGRRPNYGFLMYSTMVGVMIFGIYPSFGARACMRLRKIHDMGDWQRVTL